MKFSTAAICGLLIAGAQAGPFGVGDVTGTIDNLGGTIDDIIGNATRIVAGAVGEAANLGYAIINNGD